MWDLWFPLLFIPPIAPHSSSGTGTVGHIVASEIVDSFPLHPKAKEKTLLGSGSVNTFPLQRIQLINRRIIGRVILYEVSIVSKESSSRRLAFCWRRSGTIYWRSSFLSVFNISVSVVVEALCYKLGRSLVGDAMR
jgi:hypothetical protein